MCALLVTWKAESGAMLVIGDYLQAAWVVFVHWRNCSLCAY